MAWVTAMQVIARHTGWPQKHTTGCLKQGDWTHARNNNESLNEQFAIIYWVATIIYWVATILSSNDSILISNNSTVSSNWTELGKEEMLNRNYILQNATFPSLDKTQSFRFVSASRKEGGWGEKRGANKLCKQTVFSFVFLEGSSSSQARSVVSTARKLKQCYFVWRLHFLSVLSKGLALRSTYNGAARRPNTMPRANADVLQENTMQQTAEYHCHLCSPSPFFYWIFFTPHLPSLSRVCEFLFLVHQTTCTNSVHSL